MSQWDKLRNLIGVPRQQPGFVLHLPSGRTLVLHPGIRLTTKDLPGLVSQSSDQVVAQVSTHPQDPNVLGLQNLSTTPWLASQMGGDQKRVEPGRSIKLAEGTQVNFGTGQGTIRLGSTSKQPHPLPNVARSAPRRLDLSGFQQPAARAAHQAEASRQQFPEQASRSKRNLRWLLAGVGLLVLGALGASNISSLRTVLQGALPNRQVSQVATPPANADVSSMAPSAVERSFGTDEREKSPNKFGTLPGTPTTLVEDKRRDPAQTGNPIPHSNDAVQPASVWKGEISFDDGQDHTYRRFPTTIFFLSRSRDRITGEMHFETPSGSVRGVVSIAGRVDGKSAVWTTDKKQGAATYPGTYHGTVDEKTITGKWTVPSWSQFGQFSVRLSGSSEEMPKPVELVSQSKADKQPSLLIAPFNAYEAGAARKAWANYRQIDEERTNSIGMKLTLIPPGEYLIGIPETLDALMERFPNLKSCVEHDPNAKIPVISAQPQHKVRITRPYFLGTYEVTKSQFQKFVAETGFRTEAENDGKGGWGYDASRERDPLYRDQKFNWRGWGVDQGPTSPVVNVSWNDATAFCSWLSKKEGRNYRLPTEAEWEYACRAGTTGRYYNGDDPEGLTQIGNVADKTFKQTFWWWSTLASSDGWLFTSPTGQFRPNNFGLYDMTGNASEFCQDWFGELYSRNSLAVDPTGPAAGSSRVIRGGGWVDDGIACVSGYRVSNEATWYQYYSGFRVVCVP